MALYAVLCSTLNKLIVVLSLSLFVVSFFVCVLLILLFGILHSAKQLTSHSQFGFQRGDCVCGAGAPTSMSIHDIPAIIVKVMTGDAV